MTPNWRRSTWRADTARGGEGPSRAEMPAFPAAGWAAVDYLDLLALCDRGLFKRTEAPVNATSRERRPSVTVRGVRHGVTTGAVLHLIEKLPGGVTGAYDEEVGALILRRHGEIGHEKAVGRLLSESGLLLGHPGTEDAVLRYLPERSTRPADWDVLGDDWAICTTCDGLPTPPCSGRFELEAEMQRHTDRVHGGLTE